VVSVTMGVRATGSSPPAHTTAQAKILAKDRK
jgi:hypothetical protein